MITITQFHFLQIKLAKDALAKKPTPAPATEQAPSEPDAAPQAETAQASPEAEKAAPSQDAQTEKKGAKAAPTATPEDLTAIQQALNCDEKKAGYMFAALHLAGRRVDRVRQVRIVQAEKAPQAAIVVEDVGYILDMHPEPAKSKQGRQQDDGKKGKKRGGKSKRGRSRGPNDKNATHAKTDENKDGGHSAHADRPRRPGLRPTATRTDAAGTEQPRRPQHNSKRPASASSKTHKPPQVEVVPALAKPTAAKPS